MKKKQQLEITTLKNGLKILFYKTNNFATNISIIANTIESNYPNTKPGTAHFLEHLILEASEKYPNEEAIEFAIHKYGGNINAATSNKFTMFTVNILNKHFKKGLDVLANCIQKPLLLDKDIKKERKVILNEVILQDENFEEQMDLKLIPASYTNSPFSTSIIGNKKTIKSISKQDLLNFYQKTYIPNNMFVIIIGNIKNPVKLIEKKFVFKKQKLKKTILPVKFKQLNKTLKLTSNLVDSTKGIMLYDSKNLDNQHVFASTIFCHILDRYKGGTLSNKLRNKFSIYDFSIFKLRTKKHSAILFNFSIRDTNPIKIFKEIHSTIKNINLTEKEFDELKIYYESTMQMYLDQPKILSQILIDYETNGLDPRTHFLITEKLKKLTLKDFNKIKDYFKKPNKLILTKKEKKC